MGLLNFFKESKKEDSEPQPIMGADIMHDGNVPSAYTIPMPKKQRLSESIFFSNVDEGTEFDDRLFRNLDQAGAMDLPPQVLRRLQRLSLLLYRKNVRAFGSIELVKDFVMGDGVSFTANDDRVQAVLDEHWEANEWDDKIEERVRSLAIFGEQIYPAFVREGDGLVTLSSISPFRLVNTIRNPINAEDLIKLHVKLGGQESPSSGSAGSFTGGTDKFLDIIGRNREGKLEGQAFYFAINKISGGTRGIPDLSPSVDWLEGMDGYVFSLMERAELQNDVVFDLTYNGLNENELRKKAQQFMNFLRSGEAFAHNEGVELKIVAPQLAASDSKDMVGILMRQIQSGTRLAGLFYGDSADLTRSSASELTVPVAKYIQGRQNFIKRMLKKVFIFQIQQSTKAGVLEGVTDFGFEIQMARVFLKDTQMITTALVNLTNALAIATTNQFIDADEGRELLKIVLEQLGGQLKNVVFDPDQMTPEERELADMMNRVANEESVKPFNGVQMSAVLKLVNQHNDGKLSREGAINIMKEFMGISMEGAAAVLGTGNGYNHETIPVGNS